MAQNINLEQRNDLDEFLALKQIAKRPNVLKLINGEIGRLEKVLLSSSCKNDDVTSCDGDSLLSNSGVSEQCSSGVSSKMENSVVRSSPAVFTSASNLLPLIKLSTYAWDQSEKFVKLYVTINGVEKVSAENVQCNFTAKSFEMNVNNVNGKNYEMIVKGLLHPISVDKSYFKIKTDTVLLMLCKEKMGEKWDCVTEQEYKMKEKKDSDFKPGKSENEDLGGNIMGLMKKMYDEGDDEMKRTIKKAWCQAQEKKTPGAAGLLDGLDSM